MDEHKHSPARMRYSKFVHHVLNYRHRTDVVVCWLAKFHVFTAALRIHDCSPIPVFCFLYSKILPVTKMRLNVCFNEMALFGLFAALIKGCRSYGRNGGQPTRGDG